MAVARVLIGPTNYTREEIEHTLGGWELIKLTNPGETHSQPHTDKAEMRVYLNGQGR